MVGGAGHDPGDLYLALRVQGLGLKELLNGTGRLIPIHDRHVYVHEDSFG